MTSHKSFSPEEKELLARYVTNVEGDIFAIRNLPGIVGPVYARYSRAPGSFKETLLKEFVKEGIIDPTHAEQLIERILIAYGDDSVGELEGAHLSFENISNLATKEIEDRRIGGSPIEQSTRYVVYDEKDADGKWHYLRVPEIMKTPLAKQYELGMDEIFSLYTDLAQKMNAYYERQKPLEKAEYDVLGTGEPQKLGDLKNDRDSKAFKLTYKFDLKTKTCDTVRIVLPVATKTNVGIFGNGRYFQHLLTHLYTSPLSEMQSLATQAHAELKKVIPVFVKRAQKNVYRAKTEYAMQQLANTLFAHIAPTPTTNDVVLFSPVGINSRTFQSLSDTDDLFTTYMVAAMLYPYASHPFSQIIALVRTLPQETQSEIIATYLGNRTVRRDRPGRALEYGYPFTFDITADFGIYRDLERHRMLTQIRQLLTPHLGFEHSQDIKDAGLQKNVERCVEISTSLYEQIVHECGKEVAQYVVLFGHKLRFMLGMNLREAMHLLELRTVKQGHPSYRRICQLMHNKIKERSLWMGNALSFVDHNEYSWARADSEARQRVKEREWEEKYQKEL